MIDLPLQELNRYAWYDLSLLIGPEYPCSWPGHQPFTHVVMNYFSHVDSPYNTPLFSPEGPYHTRTLLMDEHTGTHVDAPAHFFPPSGSKLPGSSESGDISGDMLSLKQLCGVARVVDVHDYVGDQPGVSPTITIDILLQAEARTRQFREGDVVLFRTDWDKRYYKPGPDGRGYVWQPLVEKCVPGWPAADASAIEFLADRGVTCVGTDAPSMGSVQSGADMHKAGLSRRIAYIEGLANLEQIQDANALFFFLPIKVARSSGAPGRAFALATPE